MMWHDAKLKKPEPYVEVLVWVDGHRGTLWTNNYALVAYMNEAGDWLQERHRTQDPLVGVVAWSSIESPDD